MVISWLGITSLNGVGSFIEGNMNAKLHIDVFEIIYIITETLKLGTRKLYYFQQDNNPKRIAYITKLSLLYAVES